MVNGLLLIRGWNKLKNIINIEEIDIRLCTTRDVKDIFNLQNIVIENFKENEKGYFLPFKESSYLRIINNPINDGEIYGAFLDNKMIAWIFLSVSNRMKELRSYIPDIKGKYADIDGVIVLPEYRGNHLQNVLVEHIERRAKKLVINNIVSEVTFVIITVLKIFKVWVMKLKLGIKKMKI